MTVYTGTLIEDLIQLATEATEAVLKGRGVLADEPPVYTAEELYADET